MSRLTKKNKFNTHYEISITKILLQDVYDKLGKIEDLMEKYEIKSIDELEEILKENNKLKSNLTRWLALLETDGIDSKNMVATDIQQLLEEIDK